MAEKPTAAGAASAARSDSESAAAAEPLVRWPPPGLERLQGELTSVTVRLLIGGILLVGPMLWATAAERDFTSTGPFSDAWWVLVATSVIGLVVLADVLVDAFRLMRRMGRAVGRTYSWRLLVLVAADSPRDTGFLIQGGRAYSMVPPDVRRTLETVRIGSSIAMAIGALWLSVGFSIGLFLSTRGVLSAAGLVAWVVGPAALLLLPGVGSRVAQVLILRMARRRWFRQPWAEQIASEEVHGWQREASSRIDSDLAMPARGSRLAFRIGAVAVALSALLIVLPIAPLVLASGVSPAIALIAVPRFSAGQDRPASLEPLRRFAPTPDPEVSSTEAGELLHALTFVAGRQPAPLEREPVHSYPRDWFTEPADNPTGVPPGGWPQELFSTIRNASPEARAYVADVAGHPAHEHFGRLGRAAALDVAAGRLQPLSATTSAVDVPIPRMTTLRDAALAHVGRALHQFANGQTEAAEMTLRDIIGVGLLLTDQGTTLPDYLVGTVIADVGGIALENFYRATDRGAAADDLVWARVAAVRAARRAQAVVPAAPARSLASLRGMADVVVDPAAPRGLRWEYFIGLNSVTPCINLNRSVFGPGAAYERWLEEARASLVRYPSEEPLFELARAGYFGGPEHERSSAFARLISFGMGARERPGSCAAMIDAFSGT